MNAPFGYAAPIAAAVLAGVAIAAGPNYAVSLPAAVLAVAAAMFALGDAALRSRRASHLPEPAPDPLPSGTRAWLRNGTVGREEIVRLLDRLERTGLRPELPVRPGEEVDRIVRLPPAEFRRYVNHRMDEIEGYT